MPEPISTLREDFLTGTLDAEFARWLLAHERLRVVIGWIEWFCGERGLDEPCALEIIGESARRRAPFMICEAFLATRETEEAPDA